MTPIPLAELRLDRRSHKSALWWLGLLYRRPKQFEDALQTSGRWQQVPLGLRLYCHQLPYTLALCVLGRLAILAGLGILPRASTQELAAAAVSHVQQTVFGIVTGISIGVLIGITCWIALGILVGIATGIVAALSERNPFWIVAGLALGIGTWIAAFTSFWITLGIALSTAFSIALGITLGITTEIAVWLAVGLALGLTTGIAVSIAFGIVDGIGVGIAICITVGMVIGGVEGIAVATAALATILRVYYQPLHLLFLWHGFRGSRYRYHPAAWDDLCTLPFPGLDRLLLGHYERTPEVAEREIRRLIDSYPSQRFQALRARAILLARRAAGSRDLSQLDEIVASLPEGDKGFRGQTRRLREMTHEIAALQAQLDTLDRPFLREPLARLLCREIERFSDRVVGFRQPLAREFRTAASNWLGVAKKQLADAKAVLEKEPTRQVFRAGDPVDREREAFVPRNSVSGEIERQVMLATGCPGIVLYGRRRTGKSTVLRNLGGFLPPQILITGVSMQKPGAFTSLADLIATLTGALGDAVEGLEPAGADGDLRQLFRNLDEANDKLEAADRRLLLSIDEYENLDRKIGEGVFTEDLLATLRESIQTHRRITWIFTGSHEITELPSARWTSYLVSARTVEVEPFTAAETRLLLTEPLKYSKLWPKDDSTRPRFEPGFWGEGGIERIHAETGGWPHLVQLVAETVVDLLNDDQRSSADAEILERALDKAIVRGHTVLYELMRGESLLPGEWDYLAAFRGRSTQPPPDGDAVARSLRRRLLVAEDDGGWRLRVPLMERWLRERG